MEAEVVLLNRQRIRIRILLEGSGIWSGSGIGRKEGSSKKIIIMLFIYLFI